jgi:hypothetical protein
MPRRRRPGQGRVGRAHCCARPPQSEGRARFRASPVLLGRPACSLGAGPVVACPENRRGRRRLRAGRRWHWRSGERSGANPACRCPPRSTATRAGRGELRPRGPDRLGGTGQAPLWQPGRCRAYATHGDPGTRALGLLGLAGQVLRDGSSLRAFSAVMHPDVFGALRPAERPHATSRLMVVRIAATSNAMA